MQALLDTIVPLQRRHDRAFNFSSSTEKNLTHLLAYANDIQCPMCEEIPTVTHYWAISSDVLII